MNFEKALEYMLDGHSVRLSDWAGCWFIPNMIVGELSKGERIKHGDIGKVIKVFTRDGDILDSPNIARYRDRDDWEIVEEDACTFDAALRFLKNKKKVARKKWGVGSDFLKQDSSRHIEICVYEIGLETFSQLTEVVISKDSKCAIMYNPSHDDILAEDWIIVE